MSRSITLEEYLEEFVIENSQPQSGEELSLLVTDQQAQTLGYFLVHGLAGFVEGLRLQRLSDGNRSSDSEGLVEDVEKSNDFIN